MFGTLFVVSLAIFALATDVVHAEPRTYPTGMTLHKVRQTWEDANAICQREGAILASPINDVALEDMKSIMGVKNTSYFIGMKFYHTGTFLSVEGVSLENMTLTVMDMIDAIDQWDGDCLAMNSDSIRAVPCSSRLPFMCYKTNVQYSTTAQPSLNTTGRAQCDEGYKYNESQRKCYKVHDEAISWFRAEQTCVEEAAHLVVLDNESEARAMRAMFLSNWEYLWTGISDVTGNGNWKSVHGQPLEELYNVWPAGAGKPSIGNGCGVMDKDVKIRWAYCDNFYYHVICEKGPRY